MEVQIEAIEFPDFRYSFIDILSFMKFDRIFRDYSNNIQEWLFSKGIESTFK